MSLTMDDMLAIVKPHNDKLIAEARAAEMRRALQITSGWLALLTKTFNLDETVTRATLRMDGEFVAETSLAEALNIANDALEPKGHTP